MSEAIGPKPPGEVEMKSIESPIAPIDSKTGRIDPKYCIIRIDRLVRAQRLEVADYAESRSRVSAERQDLRRLQDQLGSSSSTEGSSARPIRWKSAAIAVDDASQTVFKEISKISPE